MRFLLALMILLTFPQLVHGQEANVKLSLEDKQRLQNFSSEFAICSGVYEITSEFHAATEAPNLSKSVKASANGAFMAAHWIIFSSGIIPDSQNAVQFVRNLVDLEKTRWRAKFETSTDDATSDLLVALKDCNKLHAAQEELVQQARLWLYSQNKPQD